MSELAREHLLAIFRAGLAEADPAAAVRRHVRLGRRALEIGGREYPLRGLRRVLVVGAGKASARMAEALERMLGDLICCGWVNVPRGHCAGLRRIRVHQAGHPVPDAQGLRGARQILRLVRSAGPDDLIICCLSGGASALLPMPADGVRLSDKQRITRQLLACGATIAQINAVRKHLSQVKGGQLARAAGGARIASLLLSDVVGDAPETIGSGPTAPDPTSFADALQVLARFGLERRAPPRALAHLRAGAAGERAETPKPGDRLFESVQNLVIGNNRAAVDGCARRARALGYRPLVLSCRIEGEAREAARALMAIAREALEGGRPVRPPACLIAGGETTVTLRGNGLGGRNQEFALAAAIAGRGVAGWHMLAAGTDGADGPTDAAGAFADGRTCARAERLGLDPQDALASNDSYRFFRPLGDLLQTGPTGTNVMDLYLFLVGKSPPGGRR